MWVHTGLYHPDHDINHSDMSCNENKNDGTIHHTPVGYFCRAFARFCEIIRLSDTYLIKRVSDPWNLLQL